MILYFSNYTFEAAKVACGNVAGLISWTMAMAQFYGVNKDVLPLKANLAVMQGKYMGAKRELEAAEALLDAKEVNRFDLTQLIIPYHMVYFIHHKKTAFPRDRY